MPLQEDPMDYRIISRIILLVSVVLVGLTAIHLLIVVDELIRTLDPILKSCRK
jgi:hypothetical protein